MGPFLLLLLVCGARAARTEAPIDETPPNEKCKPITVPFCMDLPYNRTTMPNLLGHASQEEAGMEVHQYFPLLKIDCSPELQLFLCSVFVPICTIMERPVPPCRSLCLMAQQGCEQVLNKFGFKWPENLNCDQFPDNSNLCVHKESSATSIRTTTVAPRTAIRTSSWDRGFVCPIQFQMDNSDYSLKVGNKTEKNCGAPCHLMFFKDAERQFARTWVGTWAILCSVSCLFTVCTFLIDTNRFRYPERPIIFLSLCYLMVSIAYIVGFVAGDSIACTEPRFTSDGVQRESTIAQGTKNEMCTILFMVLYFFSMASNIWWVILTLTWFLAAGLKWGHEAIEANSQYFHLVAWALPAMITITILAMGKVEGDVLSGVCYVGLWDVDALKMFVLAPLCIYLAIGLVILTSGLVSLCRIRTVMKHDGTKTDKLEKLMIRIGVFSLLYTVPAVIVIGCLFYEVFNFDDWMLTWNYDMCTRHTYSIPCPREVKKESRAIFTFFIVKYLMYMIVGIASTVWVWSGKTMHSWRVFFERFKSRPEAYV